MNVSVRTSFQYWLQTSRDSRAKKQLSAERSIISDQISIFVNSVEERRNGKKSISDATNCFTSQSSSVQPRPVLTSGGKFLQRKK